MHTRGEEEEEEEGEEEGSACVTTLTSLFLMWKVQAKGFSEAFGQVQCYLPTTYLTFLSTLSNSTESSETVVVSPSEDNADSGH